MVLSSATNVRHQNVKCGFDIVGVLDIVVAVPAAVAAVCFKCIP